MCVNEMILNKMCQCVMIFYDMHLNYWSLQTSSNIANKSDHSTAQHTSPRIVDPIAINGH